MRDKLRIIIFEADTKAGRRFDVALIVMILLSVLTVMLDSVPEINARYGQQLYYAEWAFTLLFTMFGYQARKVSLEQIKLKLWK